MKTEEAEVVLTEVEEEGVKMEAEDVVVVDIMINQQEVKVKKKEDIRSDRRNVEATQTKKTKRENKMIEII